MLTTEQQAAVQATESRVLVLAGAGTGKTRVLVDRVRHLLAQGVLPERIWVFTFTTRAARELKERLGDGPPARDVWASTFHAWYLQLLEAWQPDQIRSIYDDIDTTDVVRMIAEDRHVDLKRPKAVPLRELIERMPWQDQSLYGDPKPLTPIQETTVSGLHRDYREWLRSSCAIDYGLMQAETRRLLGDARYAETLRARMQHVLIDEYQDVNAEQVAIVEQLVDPPNLFVVADPRQAIYGFRGADPGYAEHFTARHPGARLYPLTACHRCPGAVLTLANRLMDGFPALTTANDREPDAESLTVAGDHADEAAELATVAQEIKRRGREPADILVLVRTNQLAQYGRRHLEEEGIPVDRSSSDPLWRREHVRRFLAYLRILLNPADRVAWRTALTWPWATAMPIQAVREIERSAARAGRTIPGLLATTAADHLDCTSIPRLMVRTLDELAGPGGAGSGLVSTAAQTIDRVLNLTEILAQQGVTSQAADIREAIGRIPEDRSVREFLRWWWMSSREPAEDRAPTGVRVLTVHAAKGLEARDVYVVGAVEGLFPLDAAKSTLELDEERRVFYVAVTRAQDRLRISHAATRYRFGQFVEARPSRFLFLAVDSVR